MILPDTWADPMVDESDHSELLSLVEECAHTAAFEYWNRAPKAGAEEFRRQYELSRAAPSPHHSLPPYWFLWAKAELPQAAMSRLTDCLERLLPSRTDTGGVHFLPGHRFGPFITPSVEHVACRLVLGAALKGTSRSVGLFKSWLEGEPMRYSQVLVLVGFKVSSTLVLRDGVRLEPLPTDPAQLLNVLPRPVAERVWGDPGQDDLPGATVLVVDHEIGPVFPHPGQRKADRLGVNVATASIPSDQWESLLLALSLSCDVAVERTYVWATADELTSILIGGDVSAGFMNVPSLPRQSTYVATQADVQLADRLLPKIHGHKNGLRVAITRWVKSKTGSVSDRLIDMRIVLESLYGVEDGRGEFTFRVATTGAWHLGESVDDRVDYHDAFHELYGKASAVIHGRMVSDGDNEINELLDKCSAAARLGILRILDEGRPSWKLLRLGGENQGSPRG